MVKLARLPSLSRTRTPSEPSFQPRSSKICLDFSGSYSYVGTSGLNPYPWGYHGVGRYWLNGSSSLIRLFQS